MLLFVLWCEKRDLNPYGVNHTPLKRARLPVPPLSHVGFTSCPWALRFATYDIIHYPDQNVKGFFESFLKKFAAFDHGQKKLDRTGFFFSLSPFSYTLTKPRRFLSYTF